MPHVSESLMHYVRDKLRADVEDLLDDPSDLVHPDRDREPAEYIESLRLLAAEAGMDLDALIRESGNYSERSRLRALLAEPVAPRTANADKAEPALVSGRISPLNAAMDAAWDEWRAGLDESELPLDQDDGWQLRTSFQLPVVVLTRAFLAPATSESDSVSEEHEFVVHVEKTMDDTHRRVADARVVKAFVQGQDDAPLPSGPHGP